MRFTFFILRNSFNDFDNIFVTNQSYVRLLYAQKALKILKKGVRRARIWKWKIKTQGLHTGQKDTTNCYNNWDFGQNVGSFLNYFKTTLRASILALRRGFLKTFNRNGPKFFILNDNCHKDNHFYWRLWTQGTSKWIIPLKTRNRISYGHFIFLTRSTG